MKKRNFAELKMTKVLRAGEILDRTAYGCQVLHMKETEEYIYLTLNEGSLADLSLDSIYECRVKAENAEEICTGRIKERFHGPEGKIIKMQIENGFYKITIK